MAEFRHYEDLFFCDEVFINFQDVWMIQVFHNFNFSLELWKLRRVRGLLDGQHFDSPVLSSLLVLCLIDCPKVPFSEFFPEVIVVINVSSLLCHEV